MNRFFIIALVALSLGLSNALVAQPHVIGDDGFNVGCCNTPQPNIPDFPPLLLEGKYGCLVNCTLEAEFLIDVDLGAPIQLACDYYLIPVTILPKMFGSPGYSGVLLAKYARTWIQVDPPRPPLQRYRFLVNGDLTPLAGVNLMSPCPYPATVSGPPARPMHVAGHVDYICEPNSPLGWITKLSLTYFEGCISHAPFSTRPLPAPANFDRSYHIVAPSAFTFMPVAEPAGPLVAEAVRSSDLDLYAPPGTAPYQCNGEAPLVQGNLQTLGGGCLCPTAPSGPLDWRFQSLTGTVQCNGVAASFATPPLPGTFLPTGLGAHPLGKWAGLPGGAPEHLTVYWGVILYDDPCQANGSPIHIVTGVGTTCMPGELFPPQFVSGMFIDLQNSEDIDPVTGGPHPKWGDPFISTIVWNLNVL